MTDKSLIKRALACAGIAVSSVALVASLSGFSSASAWGSGGGDGTAQTLGGSVSSVEKCAYSISGIASSVTLTASKTYNPDESSLDVLSGLDSSVILSAYPGGVSSNPCSFYGNSSAGRITATVPTTPAWTGTFGGTTLGWNNVTGNRLNIIPTGSSDCTSAGATLSPLGLYVGSVSGSLISITSSSTPKGCTFASAISSQIPAGLNTPQGAKTYAMTGPTITYTLSLS
jgi:hypothetical protein